MTSSDREQAVRRAIETAFAATPPPERWPLCDTYDDEGVSGYFHATTWRGHKVTDLRYHAVALSFFNPDAFRYYLPAFLLATLEDYEAADTIPDVLWWRFRDNLPHGAPDGTPVAELFSAPERSALAAYFRYESDRRAEYWNGPTARSWANHALNDLSALEAETLLILQNLGHPAKPDDLLCHQVKLRIAATMGYSPSEET